VNWQGEAFYFKHYLTAQRIRDLHAVAGCGLASFATDHPEATWKAVRDYYQKRKGAEK
jgi:hypothetical protein